MDKHLVYWSWHLHCIDPLAIRQLLISHIEDGYHVSMRHEHIG